ncbi:MAG: ATP-dependent DNA helicase [Candidatus Heimdallarchaeota archaeon LC_3]|nr:MAG: ATP-dependent DNA helicase [Candidatus Heimdallarchaeota archaeon LC_3]
MNVREYKITISDSNSSIAEQERINPKHLFPYDFKPLQEEMLEELITHPHVLWHAPTGFGKTVVALTSMLHCLLGPQKTITKIIIMVRMKTQVFRILDEAFTLSSHYFKNYENFVPEKNEKSTKSFPSEIISLPLIGKEELCVNTKATTTTKRHGQIDCKGLRCPLFQKKAPSGNELEELILSYFMKDLKSTKEIKEFLMVETPALCPYFVLKSMLKKAQIVVTTHAWLLNPQLSTALFKELYVDPSTTAIIIDEVHNFKAHQTGIISYNQIKTASLFAFRHELELKTFLSKMENQFRTHKLTMANPLIDHENSYQLARIDYAIESFLGRKIPSEEDRRGLNALRLLHNFLSTDGDLWYYDKEDFITKEGKKIVYKVMKRMMPFPETTLNKIETFSRVILMSGTLFPPRAYLTLFGLDKSFQLVEVPHEPRKIKYLTFMHPNISSRQRDRGSQLFKIQDQLIDQLHDLNPKHTLVFSTSKVFTKDLGKVYSALYPEKEIFIESTSQQNQVMLEKLRLKKHELIFATLAGGFSEGVEIKDRITEASKIAMIIFTGIPHPPPNLTQLLLEHRFIKRFGKKNTIFFLKWLPIYQTLLQAAGRGIRRPTDQCIIICLDYRLPGLGIFPKLLSTNTYNIGIITSLVQSFFEN